MSEIRALFLTQALITDRKKITHHCKINSLLPSESNKNYVYFLRTF